MEDRPRIRQRRAATIRYNGHRFGFGPRRGPARHARIAAALQELKKPVAQPAPMPKG
jgi:hypothetical protein